MTRSIRSALAGLAVAAATVATPASAEVMSFKADLRGASEVPPVASPGTGTVAATYDTGSRRLSWQGLVSGLSGTATAAHFHGPAEPGQNAGVLVPVPGVKAGPFEGSATLTSEQAQALMAGRTYFNVHTPANPNGEVRGQVVKGQ